jgi:hypothetical protein
MRRSGILVLLLTLSAVSSAYAQAADRAFETLRGLVGRWEGTYAWSGARTGEGRAVAVYHLTGNGSSLVESLFMNGEEAPAMTSVYHLDGEDLRMTHYCAAQNQPRLKATAIEPSRFLFSFVDGTNLRARPAHVSRVELLPPADQGLVLRFTFATAGKEAVEEFRLDRPRPPASPHP